MRNETRLDHLVKREDRRDVDVVAVAVRNDGTSQSVRLRNMSYEGCLMEAETGYAIGEKITLALPRMGEIRTQIRWTTADGRAGVRFLGEGIVRRGIQPPNRLYGGPKKKPAPLQGRPPPCHWPCGQLHRIDLAGVDVSFVDRFLGVFAGFAQRVGLVLQVRRLGAGRIFGVGIELISRVLHILLDVFAQRIIALATASRQSERS